MANATNASVPILNPTTPLALIPPDLANQLEISRYLYVGTLGAFIWDVLSAAPEDWKLLTSQKVRIPALAYVISRIFALAFILTNTIFQISPVPSCHALQFAIGWCWTVAVSSTSFLFYVRVKAVFQGNRWAVAFFTFMWLSNVGASFVVPFAIDGTHIPGTLNCRNSAVQPWSASTVVLSACNDTFILLAISWKLIPPEISHVRGLYKSLTGGRGLVGISKTLVRGGQQYYLITVAFNILQMSMILTPSMPPILRAMFSIPNVAITNAMACRVYRNIKLGRIPDSTILLPSSASSSREKSHENNRNVLLHADRDTPFMEIMKTVETENVMDVAQPNFRYPPQAYQYA